MSVQPLKKDSPAQDADAAYLLTEIHSADQAARAAHQHRINAGLRLAEVYRRITGCEPESGNSGSHSKNGWQEWCGRNSIPVTTARQLIRLVTDSAEKKEARKAKAQSKEPAKRRRFNIGVAMFRAGIVNTTLHGVLAKVRIEIKKLFGDEVFADEDKFTTACEAYKAMKNPEQAEEEQAKLPATAKAKFDSLVKRTIAVETARLHQEFDRQLDEKVKTATAERAALLEELQQKATAAIRVYQIRSNGLGTQLPKEDYRFLLNVLHPDREASADKRAKAFNIVNQLEKYVEMSND